MVSWILTLLTMLSLALQNVSGLCGELDLGPADDAYPWLSRM